ncbi:molybdopterin-dependent oxidoreductase [Photorhabdus laumondii]|uniref:Ferredoxin:oxidoreductase FAD/NAD(P)-binding protein n=1 Tax=Photorhabdus laumondii subsp. clarkei TaxID=2029685 RepID=A0A329VIV8_9GAMM|nr:molybdopterin-dependent oxidoreductase [Photorhabdus laumondii]RAW91888.1 ferredoxin:oxidoreductase FAD/NAD(P)-binding protein [Photorhabdus laumondii subsp. clarkei]
MKSEFKEGYCTLCRSRCGTVNEVRNDTLIKIQQNPKHPTGNAMCMKGKAAPELAHSPNRILHPLRRTNPKGDADPGWEKITWDEALTYVAEKLAFYKAESGAESVAFSVTSPSGTPLSDSLEWIERFIRNFGSPNVCYSTEVCNWHKDEAHKFTFGCSIPVADYRNAELIILWGHNPTNTWLAQAEALGAGRNAGAKLIVVDPRHTALAKESDNWLNINPGTDAALALGLINIIINRRGYDQAFVARWTNASLLVRNDNGLFLREKDINISAKKNRYVVWNNITQSPLPYDFHENVPCDENDNYALLGEFSINSAEDVNKKIPCKSAFQRLLDECQQYPPEYVEKITGITKEKLLYAADLITSSKRIAYHSWTGVAQHTNATQTERAIAVLYALTGCFDTQGSNRVYNKHPVNPVNARRLMPKEQQEKALGFKERPLGPPLDGWVTSHDLYQAILHKRPYPIRAMMAFGTNMLSSHADTKIGIDALKQLEFHVHCDLFETPTAHYADILLPVNTPWEREGLRVGFEISAKAEELVQLRQRMISPRGESRSDNEIVFDLACRLGMNDLFFNGSVEAGWNYILEPIGLTVEALREKPAGISMPLIQHDRKYAGIDPVKNTVKGFDTETGMVEIYSEKLWRHGYPPLPIYDEPKENLNSESHFPYRLTSVKNGFYCHSQQRSLTRLRKKSSYPKLEINSRLAEKKGINNGDWVEVITRNGEARFKASLDDNIAYDTIIAEFGWWQACPDYGKEGFPAIGKNSSNYNALISDDSCDPISGASPLRSFRCDIKLAEDVNPERRPWQDRKAFRVVDTKPEAKSVKTVVFESKDGAMLPDYEPGQHITVQVSIPGQDAPVIRAYSLTGTATLEGRRTYSISVRHQKSITSDGETFEGVMSSYINKTLVAGAEVSLTPPGGNFIIPLNAKQPVVMLAGGIGITPFVSYLESLPANGEKPELLLLYANQNSNTHAFSKRLKELESKIKQLKVINYYSNPLPVDIEGINYQYHGYITADAVPETLIKQQARFYMCGPAPMMKTFEEGLLTLGVPPFDIYKEMFRSLTPVKIKDGKSFAVKFEKSGVPLEWSPDKGTLLNFGEKSGIKMASGCRVGQCESCAVKLKSGEVQHLNGVEPSEQGMCLTCQCIPITDISIDA